jgi:hypothetical protein
MFGGSDFRSLSIDRFVSQGLRAIVFILEHPSDIAAYLQDQERVFEEIKAQHPMPADMIERFERAQKERSAKLS